MRQWMLRITAYAERLIDELDGLDWPEAIKLLQRNWIGRSEGAEVHFESTIAGDRSRRPDATITVFTTRPDTLFGATYMVLAPEHPLVDQIVTEEQWRRGRASIARRPRARATSSAPSWRRTRPASSPAPSRSIRSTASASRSGSPTTCCSATAPARSWPCRRTTSATASSRASSRCRSAKSSRPTPTLGLGGGQRRARRSRSNASPAKASRSTAARSTACRPPKAKAEITRLARRAGPRQEDDQLQAARLALQPAALLGRAVPDRVGRRQASRACRERAAAARRRTLDDFKPTGTRRAAARARRRDWVRYSRRRATRETNTMPQWAGSCWYYLRYCDRAESPTRFVGERKPETLLDGRRQSRGGVDLYVGGTEHAVLHLLYARFWHKVLFDLGHVSHARAVPAAGQPGPHPRRRRPEDVQEPRQRGESRRRHRASTARTRCAATRCSWGRSKRRSRGA